MSRSQEHYAILRDNYPYGLSKKNRFLRTYSRKVDAVRSAQDLAADDERFGRGEHTYEVVCVTFTKEDEK
ncbi:hypothetical protein JNUCC32_31385 (plasmid) [Paenibacillus sp. JNUCC32]|uniref:hypothetical protein n=1 Tax=Paenibacillus sp. JNUCC32 TaxID=2777984 RepID=UPI001787B661|nr:hypothetical protein [Paenibacillus sp. JNUCC-32]QOT13702.1 hypothetical protein JNUCC32_31385 [Paenibacillus sp. JNUCC-32]